MLEQTLVRPRAQADEGRPAAPPLSRPAAAAAAAPRAPKPGAGPGGGGRGGGRGGTVFPQGRRGRRGTTASYLFVSVLCEVRIFPPGLGGGEGGHCLPSGAGGLAQAA